MKWYRGRKTGTGVERLAECIKDDMRLLEFIDTLNRHLIYGVYA